MTLPPADRSRSHLRVLPVAAHAEPPPSDEQLLAALRTGDPQMARVLYERLSPVVRGTVCKLLGRTDRDLEDVCQNTLVALVTSIDNYRAESSLKSWASTIAAHTVFKHLRRRKLERAAFIGVAPEDDAIASPDRFELRAEQRAMLQELNRTMSTIDPLKRWTYLLHDVFGYDLREVAHITEVSVSAAQTRLVRGRAEVRAKIAQAPELAEELLAMGTHR